MPDAAFDEDSRLVVTNESSVDEASSRGNLSVRRIFDADSLPFESSFQTVLRNRIPAGGANERHVHADVEKVYYFLAGAGEVSCGPWIKQVGPRAPALNRESRDFLFFPPARQRSTRETAIEHEIHAGPDADLEFIVCAAQTLTTPRGLD